MIEKQPKSYPPFQPPRERLAYLLAQLSELDPEPVKKLKLEPVPVKKLNLEPVPPRKPVKRVRPEPDSTKKLTQARTKKSKLEPGRARKPAKKRELEMDSFHAVLRDRAGRQVKDNPKQRREDSNFRPWLELTQRGPLSGLARIWSWLHSKYTKSAGKRLRLSEVVSLGDKRFVALVKVEDREFLVGGAASGLSLLAQLEKTSQPAHGRKRGIGAEGRPL